MKKVNFVGTMMNLEGHVVKVGEKMKDFVVIGNDLKPLQLKDTKGVRIFLAVPSIDTEVCDMEVRKFNKEIADLEGVTCYTVSMDLPFAQARWCGNSGIEAVKTVSDFKDRSFGAATGTYIKEVGLLARASFVVDSSDNVVFVEYLENISSEPTYEEILKAAESAK